MDQHSIPPSLRIKVDVFVFFQDEFGQDKTSSFSGPQSIHGNGLWDWTILLKVVVEVQFHWEEYSEQIALDVGEVESE